MGEERSCHKFAWNRNSCEQRSVSSSSWPDQKMQNLVPDLNRRPSHLAADAAADKVVESIPRRTPDSSRTRSCRFLRSCWLRHWNQSGRQTSCHYRRPTPTPSDTSDRAPSSGYPHTDSSPDRRLRHGGIQEKDRTEGFLRRLGCVHRGDSPSGCRTCPRGRFG